MPVGLLQYDANMKHSQNSTLAQCDQSIMVLQHVLKVLLVGNTTHKAHLAECLQKRKPFLWHFVNQKKKVFLSRLHEYDYLHLNHYEWLYPCLEQLELLMLFHLV